MNGRKKPMEILEAGTSLRYLIGKCTDFKGEETMLLTMG